MNLWITFENGFREILSHKFRSALSMLGIVLGVSSLVATLALISGIEQANRSFMEELGGLELVRIVDKEISSENADFWNLSPGRTLQDARAIRGSTPLISHVSPELQGGMTISVGADTMRVRATGAWPDYLAVANNELAAGRFLADLDVERSTRAVVIGDTIAVTLWPDREPAEVIGETMFLAQVPFEVIGVFIPYFRERDRMQRTQSRAAVGQPQRARGNPSRWDPFRGKNEAVVIPISTMFHEFKSGAFAEDSLETIRLNDLAIRIADLSGFQDALGHVGRILHHTHRGVDDFGFDTREDWFDAMEQTIRSTRVSGGLIAGISLLVGGIGITNIMLASISERVREIGVRRAIGARARDIFWQIMIESVTIALLGGILGVAFGIGLIHLITTVAPANSQPILSMSSVMLSVGFAFAAGVLSGIYPALQASRLDPIGALRYE